MPAVFWSILHQLLKNLRSKRHLIFTADLVYGHLGLKKGSCMISFYMINCKILQFHFLKQNSILHPNSDFSGKCEFVYQLIRTEVKGIHPGMAKPMSTIIQYPQPVLPADAQRKRRCEFLLLGDPCRIRNNRIRHRFGDMNSHLAGREKTKEYPPFGRDCYISRQIIKFSMLVHSSPIEPKHLACSPWNSFHCL